MITHLLDTSVYCQPLRPKPVAAVVQRWQSLGDGHLAISVNCEAEVLIGLRLKRSPRLQNAYELLLQGRLEVLPVDRQVAGAFAELRAAAIQSGKARADLDLLIAATAKANQLIVATLNVRHFIGIEGVAVEDWSSVQ